MSPPGPSFDAIFEVMAAASLGDASARVQVSDDANIEETATRFAIALNILLEDLATRAAEAKEAKFRGLLEAAPDALVLVDPAGKITLVNAQTERLFGYSREELLGHPIERLLPADWSAYLSNLQMPDMRSDRELRGRRKNGSQFPADVSLAPMETSEGRVVTAAIRDITLRKQTENELKRANEELERFSYSVAHDLRSPLRAMNGYSTMLLEKYKHQWDDEGHNWLQRIVTNAERMGLLIDSLLSLARVSRTEPKWEQVNLSNVFRSSAAQQALLAPREGVEVIIAADIMGRCDPQLVQVMADNLLANAWKFTSATPHARIEFGAESIDGHPAYFVKDNGAGFDMAFADKLFVPFQRLHKITEFPGTGIGLATVSSVVRRHGGKIWADAAVGSGATFHFTLHRP